jgi:hypothetical protein
MDKELERYYETYFDLFASEGWKQFIEDTEGDINLVSDLMSVKDANDLYYRKGQLETLNRIVNFKELIERSYKEQQQDESNL